jgi:hypothetical protein
VIILHLGVNDIPYAPGPIAPRRIVARRRKGGKIETGTRPAAGQQTTGDVAEMLEAHYHPWEVFYTLNEQKIADDFANAMSNQLTDLFAGSPPSSNPFAAAESAIEAGFKRFLSNQEMDALGIPGVPTKASGNTPFRKGGINHRLKHPYAKDNPPRPSLIDTGTYQANARAWVETT